MRSLPPNQDGLEFSVRVRAVALCDKRRLEGTRTVLAALARFRLPSSCPSSLKLCSDLARLAARSMEVN
jgi:hypothetical protein